MVNLTGVREHAVMFPRENLPCERFGARRVASHRRTCVVRVGRASTELRAIDEMPFKVFDGAFDAEGDGTVMVSCGGLDPLRVAVYPSRVTKGAAAGAAGSGWSGRHLRRG